jgi:hypothetical protein
MPRDTLSLTSVSASAGTSTGAGLTIAPANGAVITASNTSRILFRVTNTNGTDRTITIKAGDNPPAFRAGLGDLAMVIPATSGDVVFSVESARHLQDDGTILIDFETSMAGKLWAFSLPTGI